MLPRTPPARRRRQHRLLALTFVCVCAAACRGERPPPARAAEPLTLRIGAALPPAERDDTGLPAIARNFIYAEYALGMQRDGRIQPRVFEGWEWLKDGTVLRLTLPRNIKFHDGSVLTPEIAADLLWRKMTKHRRNPTPGRGTDFFTFDAVTRVVPGPGVADIHLSRPEPLLPDGLAQLTMTTGPDDDIGTGPFMLGNGQSPTADVRLLAFPNYRLGPPHAAAVELRNYPTLRSAWSALMRDEIDMLYDVSNEAFQFVKAESSVQTFEMLRPVTYLVNFNVGRPVIRSREVRQALNQAIDRAAIIAEAMSGRGEIADGPIYKYHWAYSTAQRTFRYNPEAANLRLDAAGFKLKPAAEPGAMPSRFRFKCLMYGGDPRFERIALVLQKQLYDVGIDMQIEALPMNELGKRLFTGDFDAFLLEALAGRSIAYTYWVWHSRSNATGFATGYTAADAALDRLRQASEEAEVRSAVSEIQRVMYEDPPALFLAWPTVSRAVSAAIEVPTESNIDVLSRIARLKRAPASVARR